jgi:hypothetical protein
MRGSNFRFGRPGGVPTCREHGHVKKHARLYRILTLLRAAPGAGLGRFVRFCDKICGQVTENDRAGGSGTVIAATFTREEVYAKMLEY